MHKIYFGDEYVSNRRVNTKRKEGKIGKVWPILLKVLNELLSSLIFSEKFSQGLKTLKTSVTANPQEEVRQT